MWQGAGLNGNSEVQCSVGGQHLTELLALLHTKWHVLCQFLFLPFDVLVVPELSVIEGHGN